MTAAVRKVFAEKPSEFDPRKYLGPARDEMKKLYEHKIVNILPFKRQGFSNLFVERKLLTMVRY